MDNCQPQTSYPGNHQVILGTSLQTSSDKSEFYRRMLAKEGHFWQATELKNRVKNPIRIEDRNREQRINFGYARRKCHLQVFALSRLSRSTIMVRNHASQLCVAAPFRKRIPKFSGRIIGKENFSKFPEPSEPPECGKLAEDQHGEGNPCQIHKDIGERAYPIRNKGLLHLIDDRDGKGNETDEKVTRSRPLSEVGLQSQEKEDGKDPIQRHMKQAERIEGVD